ncbi:MAG TPA: C-GCAxxG-C-C family protein [Treponemataceae bacterium]|nr:C-GCAxxG-C-C family protein [Treponemataceae bacterium]
MSAGDVAVDYFCKGYNCGQSASVAFAGIAGLEVERVLSMMAGFGGGIGGTRELCGAVSGMVWAIGAGFGEYDPQDNEAKTRLYKIVRAAIDEFKAEFGTTCCRDLLLSAGCLPKPDPSVRNAEYYAKRPCAHFVRFAADCAEHCIRDMEKQV